eukprot:7436260-Ditylum_brightwellii.AAC.1
MVVLIQYALEDAAYLKTLLSKAYNKDHTKVETYVLQGLFRMTGEEVYKHHLQEHNEYMASITAVAIVGMHKDAMWLEIKVNREMMLLEHYFNKESPNIELVQ